MKEVLDEAAAVHSTYQPIMIVITKRTVAMEIKPRKIPHAILPSRCAT